MIEGKLTPLLYRAGVNLLDLRDNLGHADIKTTQPYIGAGDPQGRKPPVVFDLPHTAADLSRITSIETAK